MQLVVDRAGCDAEQVGRPTLISVRSRQRGADHFPFAMAKGSREVPTVAGKDADQLWLRVRLGSLGFVP